MKLKSKNSQSIINLKNFRPFYWFNSESRLNKFNKEINKMIKVNGVTYVSIKEQKKSKKKLDLRILLLIFRYNN